MGRRAWLAAVPGLVGLAGAASLAPGAARAQGFPDRPVRIVQGFAPGGPADLIARTVAERLFGLWRHPVVVESRPGASGSVAASVVARAAPDGHTLGLIPSTHAVTPSLIARLPYDALNDFTPIALIVYHPQILVVHPALTARSVTELVAYATAHPGEVTFGTTGVGSSPHLGGAMLGLAAGAEFTFVQYSGTSTANTALLVGEVKAMFLNPLLAVPAVRDGRLRALGTAGAARWRDLPDVPTVAEQSHPGFEAASWYGIMGPAGLPEPLVARLHADVQAAMRAPDLRARLTAAGFDLLDVGPAEFRRTIESDMARWAELIRKLGIRPD
jgi:tripartite-type tricarboxylate transporter receptor subunit TctC